MFNTSSTWRKIDALEEFLYYRDCHGEIKDTLKDALGKLYLLAWLQAFRDRGDEALLAGLAAALAWQAIPRRIRKALFTNVDSHSTEVPNDIRHD